jgi:excisionase family DNA binding protein
MKNEFTAKEAAEIIGVSYSRIRQMAAAGEIDHHRFGNLLVITPKGIEQAKARKTKPGPAGQKRGKKAA